MKKVILCFVVFGFLAGVVSAQGKSKPVLPEKYKKWLNEEVVYIITSRERAVFLQLETDRERDIFIEAFWKHRDPTPGTPENEFKEEHYKRIAYANEYYGRGTTRPGWMTDQGRIYIILGPPQNIEEYDTVQNVFPAKVWFYLGDPAYGLPTGFHIIFFRKNGMGEYVIYSPVDDGPESLLADWGTGLTQDAMGVDAGSQSAYKQLVKLAPNLAYQTLSLVDGERVPSGTVSLASMKLINDVISSPQKKVEDTYADALLKYKDVIDVDYSANYIASDAFLSVIKDPSGLFLVEYSVEPKKISVDSYGSKYGANFELDGRVSDAKGTTVYQYVKEFPLSFSSAEFEDLRAKSLAIQDLFPLVPGNYKFDLLLKNTVSKEFASFEGSIDIPEATGAGAPAISALVLGYQLDKTASADRDFVPFKTAAGQLICQASKTFSRKDNLYVFFQVFGLSPELRSQGKINVTVFKKEAEFLTRSKGINEYGPGPDFLEEFALADFPPDYYNIKISLVDGSGKEMLASDENFEVSLTANLPRPLIISKVMPASHSEEYDYILGLQMLSLGRQQEAHALLEKAYRKNPGQLKYALGFSQVLFELTEFQKVKDILSPFASGEQGLDQVYYLLGKSSFGLGQYAEAVPYFRDYLTRYGANLEILNLLGLTYYKLGDTAQALAAWKKSLEINPKQEEIKKLVDSLPK
jgi:GWxTD domain-containing protein